MTRLLCGLLLLAVAAAFGPDAAVLVPYIVDRLSALFSHR